METEYFSQIDADDVLDLEVLFKHTGLLKRMPEIDVVYGKVEFIDEEARQVVKFDPVEGAPEDPLIH